MLLRFIQVALPPTPGPPLLGPGQLDDVLIGLVIIAFTVLGMVIVKPLVRALARRIESKGVDAALRAEVESLHERAAEIEPLQRRVLELEERLEFTERLLAQRHDRELASPGGEH